MKQVNLTNGKQAIVDDEDYDLVSKWKWYANKGSRNKGFYASRCERQADRVIRIFMHREILKALSGDRVKFRNGDSLDCRKENMLHTKKGK